MTNSKTLSEIDLGLYRKYHSMESLLSKNAYKRSEVSVKVSFNKVGKKGTKIFNK